MKKLILSLVLTSASAFAGTPEVYKAVLDSPEMKNFSVIQKIEVRRVFRCPQCYEIAVQGKSPCGSMTMEMLFQTKVDSETQAISATKVESEQK